MQAVILAAGRGSRMGELTEMKPKPMLPVGKKTLLEHKLDALPASIDEVIFIVGYKADVVRSEFGDTYKGKRIRYATQENPVGGTANALWQARELLNGRYLVMNGDNLYAAVDMENCVRCGDWAVLVQKKDKVLTGRVIVENGLVVDIAENSAHGNETGYANTGLYMLDMRFFDYQPVPKAPGSTELGLPQTMLRAVGTVPIHAIEATFWLETKSPEDLAKAETILARN